MLRAAHWVVLMAVMLVAMTVELLAVQRVVRMVQTKAVPMVEMSDY